MYTNLYPRRSSEPVLLTLLFTHWLSPNKFLVTKNLKVLYSYSNMALWQTISCIGGHLGFIIYTKWNFVNDHPIDYSHTCSLVSVNIPVSVMI